MDPLKQPLLIVSDNTNPSSSGQTKMACKWQRRNPCWSACTENNQFALRNKHSASISGNPRKAHLLGPARGLEWEREGLGLAQEVAKAEREMEMAKDWLPLPLGTASCCLPCRWFPDQCHKSCRKKSA